MNVHPERGPTFRRKKGQRTRLTPKIVHKEIHGQLVAVKVYPPAWAEGATEKSLDATRKGR